MDRIIERVNDNGVTELHRQFAGHLVKVSKALHDLEWVLSGDYGEGDEIKAILAVLNPPTNPRTTP